MKLSIIVAMSSNRIIGINNRLPWHLPADLQWFKQHTLNKAILMGRKTWESLPIKPLPGRRHIILSRNADYVVTDNQAHVLDIPVVDNLAQARQEAALWYQQQPSSAQELMVIGGASIYQMLLPSADSLYLTIIDKIFSGDACFPDWDDTRWSTEYSQQHYDPKGGFNYSFMIKNRI